MIGPSAGRGRRAGPVDCGVHTTQGAPVELDRYRGMAAQKATDLRRRRLYRFQAGKASARQQQKELDKLLAAAPAEATAEALDLIELFVAVTGPNNLGSGQLIGHGFGGRVRGALRPGRPRP